MTNVLAFEKPKRKPVVIAGYSDNIHNLSPKLFEDHEVFCVNHFPELGLKADHWIVCDTHHLYQTKRDLVASNPWLNRVFQYWPGLPRCFAHLWFDQESAGDPATEMNIHVDERNIVVTKLRWSCVSAMAAVHFALLQGHRELVLAGVDLYGNRRAASYHYAYGETGYNHWEAQVEPVNALLGRFAKVFGATIYKTREESPLELPMWPELPRYTNN